MTGKRPAAALTLLAVALLFCAPANAAPPSAAAGQPPVYKPPLRGAPGGRVGGASRGTVKLVSALPTISLIAPDSEAGETTGRAPTLYYYVSGPAAFPFRLTISAPWQAAPVIETTIPSPHGAGIHRVRLDRYGVRLAPGILYTWSISAVVNPLAPSRDVVASASLLRVAADPATEEAARIASPERRAAVLAQAGLWYDAVAAAADAASGDQAQGLRALMQQVGLRVPAALTD
ncbi:MAG TPA: DUF928 domain-containing protein [Stellaceae bacterium]|nr:DUF928 domain-containing protein [Stellaceae bacterium]